jgi:hypothetical protein
VRSPTDTSNFDDFEEADPWVPHFHGGKNAKAKAKQDMRFVGFTFKKASDDSKLKNIVSLFDEIEQARDKEKKRKLQIETAESAETSTGKGKGGGLQFLPLRFPTSPKTQTDFQPTVMVSPKKETSVRIPITIKATSPPNADKKFGGLGSPPPVAGVAADSKKLKENSETGKMLYMGGYKKGQLGFQRSSSNGPANGLQFKPASGAKEPMGSPKKAAGPLVGEASSARKPQGLAEVKKSDYLGQNVMMSPSSQAAAKKKGFGFLGLKFLTKNKS